MAWNFPTAISTFYLLPLFFLCIDGGTHHGSRRWVSNIDTILRSQENKPVKGGPPGCILFMDDRRFKMNYPDLEKWGEFAPFWLFSRVINRAYAERHGYRFILARAKDYETTPKRAASWYKILFAKAQLQCCCEWVMFLDSDAYFRMSGHDLSIEQWLHKLTEPDYFNKIRARNVNMTTQLWFPKDPVKLLEPSEVEDGLIALFPRNGDSTDGACGGKNSQEKDSFFTKPDDEEGACFWGFMNAGQFMLRNSSLTHQFLDEWFHDPDPTYFNLHPWEQKRVNAIAHRYKRHIAVVPFREMTGHGGIAVRHYWRDEELRQRAIRAAALGLMARQEARYSRDD